MDELFENDENVVAVAQNGDDKIIYITCEPSAISDGAELEALPTFDQNTVIVAINSRIINPDEHSPEEMRELLSDILAKGTMLAEEIFASRS